MDRLYIEEKDILRMNDVSDANDFLVSIKKQTNYEHIDIESLMKPLGGIGKLIGKGDKVLLKTNLLNAKLLYSQRLTNLSLNNKQKSRVIDAMDRAKNLHEVKLTYVLLGEAFRPKKQVVKKGASEVQKKTQIISEGYVDNVERVQKIAGIKKKSK